MREIRTCVADNGDGSFADPAVRITQFVNAFHNGVVTSICDDDYTAAMVGIAQGIGALMTPRSQCINYTVAKNAHGNPNCVVTDEILSQSVYATVAIPDCLENNDTPPCWTLAPDTPGCQDGGLALTVSADPNNPNVLSTTIECDVCQPGSIAPGC